MHHDAEIVLGGRRVPLATVTIPELRETPIVRGEFHGFVPTLRDVFLRYGSSGRYLVELKPGPSPRPVSSRVPRRGSPRAARASRKSRRSLLLARRAPPYPGDRAARRDVPQLRRDGAPARRAALARPSRRAAPRSARTLALVSDALFARAKAEGLSVHVWTVNDPALAAQLARQGAASVISDDVSVTGPAIREVTGAFPRRSTWRCAARPRPACSLTREHAGRRFVYVARPNS